MLKPASKQAKTPPKRVEVNIGRAAAWEIESIASVIFPPLQSRLFPVRIAVRLSAPSPHKEIKKMWAQLTSV
jgi:hypothetical protein